MNNIKDSIGLQFTRIKILEGISEARKNLGFTTAFFDSCSYCIARCILQDLISIQHLKKYDNEIIKKFYNKYKDTRDFHSHFFESNKKDSPISLEELKTIVIEFHKMINEDPKSHYVYTTDNTIGNLLTKAFSVLAPKSDNK